MIDTINYLKENNLNVQKALLDFINTLDLKDEYSVEKKNQMDVVTHGTLTVI